MPEKGLKVPVVDTRCAGIARKRMFNGHYARMYTLYTLYTLYTWKIKRQEQVYFMFWIPTCSCLWIFQVYRVYRVYVRA